MKPKRFANGLALSMLMLLIAAPAVAQQEAVTNLDESNDFSFDVGDSTFAQSFTTGEAETRLVSVTIAAQSDSGGTSRVDLFTHDGQPDNFITTIATATIPVGESLATFTSPGPIVLQPNTTYWLAMGIAGTGSGSFNWTGTAATDQTSCLQWGIEDQALTSNNFGFSWQPVQLPDQFNESCRFAVEVQPVQQPDNILVTRSQTLPAIDFGPLSFGLTELPPELDVTFLLSEGTPMSGLIAYDIDNVISAEVVFGDASYTVMDSFFMTTFQSTGEISQLAATFAPTNTLSVADGSIVLNSPATITGTDIASGRAFSYTYAESTDTITTVAPPGNNILVTRRQSLPVIDSGPLSFGLSELPAELDYTVLLKAKSSLIADSYDIDDVIFSRIELGDGTFTEMDTFSMEIEFDGSVESFSASLSPIFTPSVSNGVITLNSPAFITGTDIASGMPFSYTYTESVDTVIKPTFLGDVNLDCIVDLLDVAPFVDRIANGNYQLEADVNEDGAVNLLDVAPFIEILNGG